MVDYRDNLLANLSEEERVKILQACGLEDKQEYLESEGDLVRQFQGYLESGKNWQQAVFWLRKERKDEAELSFSLIELKQLAETQLSISATLQILSLCGLPEQDFYTEKQAELFVECCSLREQGKSPEEIAQHFGVEGISSVGKAQVKQVFERIEQMSEVQQQQLLETLAQTMVNQRVQVEKVFNQLTYTKLHQALNSGELEAKIDAQIQQNVGNELTLQAMVETWTEEQEQSMLPPLEEEKNILPSSSTN